MNKSVTPKNSDADEPAIRDLQNALRVTEAERDTWRNEFNRSQNEAAQLRNELKKSEDIKVQFAQLENIVNENQDVAYTASLRIALIASAFNAFAWVAAFLLIAFDNPTAAYFAAAGGFGATGVIFLLAAFKRDWLERVKSIFARRRR